ncbi:MAG: hypothetical protein A2096_07645 [Spirochaetes bacterium GWF1_41_5]|nr:MAG: hypothetical protein A2096_07645 [Spirochaetes bacterium GWF1_41_5]
MIDDYLQGIFRFSDLYKAQKKAITFFFKGAIESRSLTLADIGRTTKTALPRNGIKRMNHLVKMSIDR